MDGQYLRNKLKNEGVKLVKLAEQLGLSPQLLSARFKSANIGTDLIEDMSVVLNKDVSWFFEDKFKRKETVSVEDIMRNDTPEVKDFVCLAQALVANQMKLTEMIEKQNELLAKLVEKERE